MSSSRENFQKETFYKIYLDKQDLSCYYKGTTNRKEISYDNQQNYFRGIKRHI